MHISLIVNIPNHPTWSKQTHNFSRPSKLVLSSDCGGWRGRKMRNPVKLVRNRPSHGGGLGYQGVAEGWHFPGHLWFFVHTSTLLSPRVARELSKVRTTSTWNKKKRKKKRKGLVERERERKRARKKNGEERKSERGKEGEFIVANGVGCDKTAELDRLLLQSASLLTISYKGFYGRILFYSRKKTTFRNSFEKEGRKKWKSTRRKKRDEFIPRAANSKIRTTRCACIVVSITRTKSLMYQRFRCARHKHRLTRLVVVCSKSGKFVAPGRKGGEGA